MKLPTSIPAPHDEIAAFASRLADASGDVIRPHFRHAATQSDDKTGEAVGVFDPVTIADRGAEEAIRKLIDEHRPDDGVLGEEFPDKESRNGTKWVLDPIDGTRAFISGFPTWGTLIAYHDGTKPSVGIMDQPFVGERFIGWPGGAALMNRHGTTPLKTRECADLSDAIFACTTHELFKTPSEIEVYEHLERTSKMLRLGTDCYSYCLLAHGLVDVVLEASLKPFDIQALIPIVVGAGGTITNWQGGSAEDGGQVLATGDARLHNQILDFIGS